MQKNEGFNFKNYALSSVIGAVVGLVLSLLALLGVAALVLSGTIAEGSMGIVVSVVLFIGALVGGFIAMKRGCVGVLIAGPSVGIILYLLLSVVRMMFYGQFMPSDSGLANLIAAIAGGAVGALLAGGTRKKRRKSKR